MNEPSRGTPYVWVTWITSFLAQTDKCYWKPWYKSHFKYAKYVQPGDSDWDLASWTRTHDAMVNARAEKLKLEGYEVRVEEDNSFKLSGKNATLSGKPDVIGLRLDKKHGKVIDSKSGKEKLEHIWQVLLYMFAMPMTRLKGFTLEGEVEYPNKVVPVTTSMLDSAAVANISRVMNIIGSNAQPPRVPSRNECRYCDILRCPDRFQEPEALGTVVGDASKFF
jgi:CRISPR/Cas system-associated exonuclease Cas4 (RecB family)